MTVAQGVGMVAERSRGVDEPGQGAHGPPLSTSYEGFCMEGMKGNTGQTAILSQRRGTSPMISYTGQRMNGAIV